MHKVNFRFISESHRESVGVDNGAEESFTQVKLQEQLKKHNKKAYVSFYA